ncbi:MAG: primosomal protein N' [Pseudomonadales bacterium]|nr:primosomal protein N' [Pseudomonadales bacterium]
MNKPVKILSVAVPVPLSRLFDYRLDENSEELDCNPGQRVWVSFGNRKLVGVIVEINEQSDLELSKIKSVLQLLDPELSIPESLMRLCTWAASYYHYPIGEVFSAAIPALLRSEKPVPIPQITRIALTTEGEQTDPGTITRSPKQQQLLEYLQQNQRCNLSAIQQLSLAGSPLQSLIKKGLAEKLQVDEKFESEDLDTALLAESNLALNSEQQVALDTITQQLDQYRCYLLEGVTGSGKTEVYLQAMEKVLQNGQQVLVLIPEIGLTPQTMSRFQNRFNCPQTVLHSGRTEKQRLRGWQQALSGHAKIVIGTRSAIFTPFANLGLIIIDEEHDASLKQQEGFRYSARDLAITRAHQQKIPVILGSATPCLESLYNADQNRYTKLELTQRAGEASKPVFRVVDLRGRPLDGGMSQPLVQLIRQHIEQNNQVLIFLNRRGFAPVLMCHECGWISECRNCDTRMTLHHSPYYLHCHHCDHKRSVEKQCPECKTKELNPVGLGTERAEQVLQELFPDTPVMRVDRDSTRRKNTFEKMLAEIQTGEPCILIGTQMLAKGHHFPHVTLAAILDADSALYSSDFRGMEKMGQLLTQVAGRAGREKKQGEVAIQTHEPNHPLLHLLFQEGYPSFARELLKERRLTGFPPNGYIALIHAQSTFREKAEELLQTLSDVLPTDPATEVLGPIPSAMERRAGRYRFQLLLRSDSRQTLHTTLNQCLQFFESHKIDRNVRWQLDVDPVELF